MRIGTATRYDIQAHLQACDLGFDPPLSTRVQLDAYAAKLEARAVTYEAWIGVKLVGLIAAYMRGPGGGAFITSVSVIDTVRGHGIARSLLEVCITDVTRSSPGPIELDVSSASRDALGLYRKAGFTVSARRGSLMRLELHAGD